MAIPTVAESLLRGHARYVIIPEWTLLLASCWPPRTPARGSRAGRRASPARRVKRALPQVRRTQSCCQMLDEVRLVSVSRGCAIGDLPSIRYVERRRAGSLI